MKPKFGSRRNRELYPIEHPIYTLTLVYQMRGSTEGNVMVYGKDHDGNNTRLVYVGEAGYRYKLKEGDSLRDLSDKLQHLTRSVLDRTVGHLDESGDQSFDAQQLGTLSLRGNLYKAHAFHPRATDDDVLRVDIGWKERDFRDDERIVA